MSGTQPPGDLLIGGVWRRASATLPAENPSTGAVEGEIARGTAADIANRSKVRARRRR